MRLTPPRRAKRLYQMSMSKYEEKKESQHVTQMALLPDRWLGYNSTLVFYIQSISETRGNENENENILMPWMESRRIFRCLLHNKYQYLAYS